MHMNTVHVLQKLPAQNGAVLGPETLGQVPDGLIVGGFCRGIVRIGSFVDTEGYAVRPAMWIRTEQN